MTYETKLISEKIHAENETRKILNLILPKVYKRINDFKGMTILKKDDTLLKSINDDLSELIKDYQNISITPLIKGDFAKIHYLYFKPSSYDLTLKIGISFNGGNYDDKTYYCFYHDKVVYLANLKERYLTELYPLEQKELNPLNAEEQINIFNQIKAKKEELDYIKAKLFYPLRESLRLN